MRRAFAGLRCRPGYALIDGFPVRGLGVPALAVWKGDRVTASVAAASVLAKVSRDRMMRDLHERYPLYGFDRHKGYNTDDHVRALAEYGPCPAHRYSFVNVMRAATPGASFPAGEPDLAAASDEPGRADDESLAVPADLVPAGAATAGGGGHPSQAGASGEIERRMSS
jgi:ribonuclease HII